MTKPMHNKQTLVIEDYCQSRIKPQLIRDVKTEAILVFARTILERFFKKIDNKEMQIALDEDNDTNYVYTTLTNLLKDLEQSVVSVDYLIELTYNASKYPQILELQKIRKQEEPLILYYDTLAKNVDKHFPKNSVLLPEFIVVTVLSNWFIENEKSTNLYKFIEKYDLLKLIETFEKYTMDNNTTTKEQIKKIFQISIEIVEKLENVKYKINPKRVSKQRKKRR